MNYLLDTHIFLWTLFSPGKISKSIKGILADSETVKYVSVITFWEISLKFSIGKLDVKGFLPDNLPDIAAEANFKVLNLESDITSSFYKLPVIKNKDPFDRMLAWQAIGKDLLLLTKDRDFSGYKDHGLRIVM